MDNGKGTLGERIAARFNTLIGQTRREGLTVRAEVEAPERVDPDLALAQSLGTWLDDERCQKIFMAWLEQNMEQMLGNAHAKHANPIEATYALGTEAGLRFVRDRLKKWAKRG